MHASIEMLLLGWNKNLGYGVKLVTDVPEEKFAYQPGPGMNHPAWVLAHLSAYHPVITAMLRGEPFDDPKGHRFGMQSQPEADLSLYGTKASLIAAFEKGHADVVAALQSADPSCLNAAMTLERWREPMPKIGPALGYLMLVHESTHLGQLSVWRRVQGMPRV